MEMEDDELEELVTACKDWQITHGSLLKLVKTETSSTVLARPVGVSILPVHFALEDFQQATFLQPLFNELYLRAAADFEWLSGVLDHLIKHDDFCRTLWEILLETRKAGSVQDITCGLFRSDYMSQVSGIKQVEMNTFSVAGACHAERVANMHHHLNRTRATNTANTLPKSDNTASIVALLSEAHKLYKSSSPSRQVCVLIIVQPSNFNIADERPIEYGLWDRDTPCYRCNWDVVLDSTRLDSDRTLLFHHGSQQYEVGVVYFRAGYDAEEYSPTGKQTRLLLELSRAIKCPNISTHLTTLKAVQSALTRPGAVERFLSAEQAAEIRKTFMPMQTLDSSVEGQEACRQALDLATAIDYVLKPNLEGGGHNVYRDDIPEFLSITPREEWHRYILMRLIQPLEKDGCLMTANGLFRGPTVSELGVIGACLWQNEGANLTVLENSVAGWTFKTKPKKVDEMSVVKGYGCFSTPCLVANEDV